MAKYGALYLMWAKFAETSPDADPTKLPKYGTPLSLGSLVSVADTVNVQTAQISGDDVVEDRIDEVSDYSLAVGITELENNVASEVLGATLESDSQELSYGFDDEAPQGGLGLVSRRKFKGKRFFKGIFYPKVQAVRQGVTYNTKGTSITLAGDDLQLNGTSPACRKAKIESKAFDTEELAKAWVDAKFTEANT